MVWLGETWTGLRDLVLPGSCAGCGGSGPGALCAGCGRVLAGLRAHPVRPTPAPPGLPRCVALGGYEGVLRELLLAYKERGRHTLARTLGDLLAGTVAAGLRLAAARPGTPVLLVPVPDTAAAARDRYGDHMLRLARRAAVRLNATGWPTGLATPLSARPRADSAHLDSTARARAAALAFAPRPRELSRMVVAERRGALVITLDDILTTGATLSAAAGRLRAAGIAVHLGVVLAATRRRSGARAPVGKFRTGDDWTRNKG
jgi:predicted amidophosphoribosyltransferase